jgi:hypothetical protein
MEEAKALKDKNICDKAGGEVTSDWKIVTVHVILSTSTKLEAEGNLAIPMMFSRFH